MRTQIKRPVWQYRAGDETQTGRFNRKRDYLTAEEPLEMQLHGRGEAKTLAITMRTPGHDYELTAGFLFNEGIIEHPHELAHMTYCVGTERDQQEYNLLAIQLRGGIPDDLPQLDRHFFTSSACGICGTTMLEELEERQLPPIPDPSAPIPPEMLLTLNDKLRAAQEQFDATGGIHAAALFTRDGELVELREDVGRHNALDKLIGWAFLNGRLPFHDQIIMVSGRASYELLQKAAVAGAPVFCAVSAPSSLAVSLAHRFNITLVGFLRHNRFNLYTHRGRIADG